MIDRGSDGAMKAVLCKEWGEPSTLVEEIEAEPPTPGEVLIDVHASGMNFADARLIAGQ